jgi:uncharacterized phage protein (TIGR01671 family)
MQAGREIKFQAWVPDIGQMVQVAEIDLVHGVVSWYTCEAAVMSGKPDADAFLDRVKLRLFTGLKDRNGREIYEGDILKDEFGRISQAYWVDKEARFTIRERDRKTEYFMVISHLDVEVIGNVYENPELFQEKAG